MFINHRSGLEIYLDSNNTKLDIMLLCISFLLSVVLALIVILAIGTDAPWWVYVSLVVYCFVPVAASSFTSSIKNG